MTTFTRILANVDAIAPDHPALDLAADLAARMQASVTVVDVLPAVPDKARAFVTEAIEQELVDARWEQLRKLADGRGDRFDAQLLRGAPPEALVLEVQRGGYDLLVRAHGAAGEGPRPYGPIDMKLLRKCPCPVWLVGPASRPRPRRIAAAIDAGANTSVEADLNRDILDLAVTIGDLTGADVTVVYAWSVFGAELLQHRMSAQEYDEYVAGARTMAEGDLEKFVSAIDARQHKVSSALLSGDPQHALPPFLDQHKIDLVVMGTIARTGIAGLVIGNTAERMLTAMRGSVLAIKPKGWGTG
jgi:universal stress protein E